MMVWSDDKKSLGGDLYRLTLFGSGTVSDAITAGYINNGYYVNDKEGTYVRIAQGSVYMNVKTMDVAAWDEESKSFGS